MFHVDYLPSDSFSNPVKSTRKQRQEEGYLLFPSNKIVWTTPWEKHSGCYSSPKQREIKKNKEQRKNFMCIQLLLNWKLESKPNKQDISKSQEKKKQFENTCSGHFYISLNTCLLKFSDSTLVFLNKITWSLSEILYFSITIFFLSHTKTKLLCILFFTSPKSYSNLIWKEWVQKLTFLQEISVLHLNDIPTRLFGQSKEEVDKKEIQEVQRPQKERQHSWSALKPQILLTGHSTPPKQLTATPHHPLGPCYLDHPTVHRQGGADHMDIGCGCWSLPLGKGTFRGGTGGVEGEGMGCGVSVLGTRWGGERKVHVDTQASPLVKSTTYFINILRKTPFVLQPLTKCFNMHHLNNFF